MVPFYVISGAQSGQKQQRSPFLAVFNNFDPLTYNIVNTILSILFELLKTIILSSYSTLYVYFLGHSGYFNDIFKNKSKCGFYTQNDIFWDIYPLFSYICKNGWWNKKTYKVWHFGPFSTILRWFLVFYQCILVIFSKSLFETQWPGLGPQK